MNIIIPYRPSIGSMCSFFGELVQDSNERWLQNNKYINQRDDEFNIPKRAIEAILKNSRFKHNIIVAIDSDMFPHKKWLKEYDNVRIFKGSSICPDPPYESLLRMTALENEVILSLPDDEFTCHAYIADLVCSKNWDVYIEKAIDLHGDGKIYVPMFVEPRSPYGPMSNAIGEEAKEENAKLGPVTFNNIWHEWRKLCCNSLGMHSPTDKEFLTEEDFDKWIQVATSENIGENRVILEKCGLRHYGYWAPLISKNRRFKQVLPGLTIGPGWDLSFEAALGEKVVVTRSFVFHIHLKVILDNQEVKHAY